MCRWGRRIKSCNRLRNSGGVCTAGCAPRPVPARPTPPNSSWGCAAMWCIGGGGSKMFNPRDIINLIAANVRKSRNPFGIPNSQINTWWREAPGFTRRPGDALLLTGLMYQSIPYIEATTRYLERLEGSRWADYLRFGRLSRYIPSFVVGRGFSCLTSKASMQQFNGILGSICRLLSQSAVGFFYHPEMDFYSGILLYDLGDQEGFVEHARFVAGTLKLHGVQKIITVDPHTTYALKELYPKYTGVSFEVQPYFALLRPNEVS